MKPTHIILITLMVIALLVGSVSATVYQDTFTPIMTSNTTPAPNLVEVSTWHSGGANYAGWYGFNHAWATYTQNWVATIGSTAPQWISIYTPTGHIARNYTIWSSWRSDDPSWADQATPRAWQFQGSNDNATWDTLDTQTGQTWISGSDTTSIDNKSFEFANAISYTNYRLNITQGGTSDYFGINELYIYEEMIAPVASFTSDAYVGTDPLTATLTDTSTNVPTSWSYKIRNETAQTGYEISTEQNPAIVLGNGTFRVNLTATNAAGSDTSDDVWINVSSTGVTKPIAISSLSRSTIRAGGYTWFNDTSQNTPTYWNRTFGDGTYAATANGTKGYWRRGIYNVSSYVSNDAGANTSYNIIRVI